VKEADAVATEKQGSSRRGSRLEKMQGQALDGIVHNSETTSKLAAGYLNGERSLPEDLKDILSDPAIDSETLKNLSVSGALTKMMARMDDGSKSKVQSLLSEAKKLGL
jgi:hypothetical protein